MYKTRELLSLLLTTVSKSHDYISVLLQVDLEGVYVLLESERGHGPEQIVPVDCLALLLLALVAGPTKPNHSEDQNSVPRQNQTGRVRSRSRSRHEQKSGSMTVAASSGQLTRW